MEGKAQLVGIHERVRSDFEGNIPRTYSSQSAQSNPNAENAAELMRYSFLFCQLLEPYRDKFVQPLPVVPLIPVPIQKMQKEN